MLTCAADIIRGAELFAWRSVPEAAIADYKAALPQIKEAQKLVERGNRTLMDGLLEGWNLVPGHYPGGIPNSPGPLQSMLTGGLAGGALGYGAGWLGEKLMPERWQKNRLKWTLAMMGMGGGMLPGAIMGTVYKANGLPFSGDGSLLRRKSLVPPPAADLGKTAVDNGFVSDDYHSRMATIAVDTFHKAADFGITGFGSDPIPVDTFNRVLWADPRVADRLEPATQAAASGLTLAAANLPGKRQTNFVTPMDMARVAAGMGSGYVSGAIVGKGLGLLLGMPEATQERLKNTGMWAGIVANLVPIAFGG